MLEDKYEIFKVLADKSRLEIIKIIINSKEICACELLDKLNITQATLSYHMKLLKEVGLVSCYKRGTWCIYSIEKETFNNLSKLFKEIGENNG